MPVAGVDASDCYVLLPGAGGRFGVGKGWTRLRRWPPCGGLVTGTAISGGAPSFKAVRPDQARPEHYRAPGQLDSVRPRRMISREVPANWTRERAKIKIFYVASRDAQELAAKPGWVSSRVLAPSVVVNVGPTFEAASAGQLARLRRAVVLLVRSR